jgi:hypothetical protein
VKLCHRHLPIGQTLHRRDPKYSPTCPGCREQGEDQHHYLQCAAPSRIEWRISLLSELKKQMIRLQTDEHLQATILDVIDRALATRAIPIHGPFRAALEAQEKIGWLAMLRGYWATAWQESFEATRFVPLNEEKKDRLKRQIQMAGWQRKVIQTMWGMSIKLWKLRNDERHGWDKESRDRSRREVLHKELEDLYLRKDEYPARVQRLLRDSYEIHIQESVTKLADWLDAYKGTFAVTWAPD